MPPGPTYAGRCQDNHCLSVRTYIIKLIRAHWVEREKTGALSKRNNLSPVLAVYTYFAKEEDMTIAVEIVQRHFQTLVADTIERQTLIADDISCGELAIGHPAPMSGREEVV